MLQALTIILGLALWPISLFRANTLPDLVSYILPPFLLSISFLLLSKSSRLYFFPILFIPFFEPKLAPLPLIFSILIFLSRRKRVFTLCFLSFLVLILNWKGFFGQTIFVPDYEKKQEVVRNTQLYDSIFLARLFHNKARVVFDKFSDNFFALTDPNNYFFGFHPRQITGNQNLVKFPFPGIIFLIYGLFHLRGYKYKKFLILALSSSLLSLSILNLFDRNDFILWVPFSLLLLHAVNTFGRRVASAPIFFITFCIFGLYEVIRILI